MEFTKASLFMELEKVMVHLNGIMVRYLKENGEMELKMDMVFGNLLEEIITKEVGNLIDNMARVSTSIKSVRIVDISYNF
jgi:hypothetical protein